MTPLDEPQFSAAVVCVRTHRLHIKIQSGDQYYEGISYISNDLFIVLDIFNVRSINVHVQDELAWVQAEEDPALAWC